MLSRVADSLYWMRRYVERADQIARVVHVNLDLAFDHGPRDVTRLWGRLLTALEPAPDWAQVERTASLGALSDLASVDAVAGCVAAARENARQVRQHISGEMWSRLNGLHLTLGDAANAEAWAERPHEYFQAVRDGAALFHAAVSEGMVRDDGWQFAELGLYIERAGGTARLVACQLRAAGELDALDEQLDWICLLKACDALELYRRRHRAELNPDRVVQFLIADPQSPRTVRYALDQIDAALLALAGAAPDRPSVPLSSPHTEAAVLTRDGTDPLHAIAAIEAECSRVHHAVYQTYIDQRPVPAA